MDKIWRYILPGLLIVATHSCTKNQEVDCPEKELQQLSFDFESNLSEWESLGGKIEVLDSSYFAISGETAYSGSTSAKFTVSPDSYINAGVRSELSFDQLIEEGDETFYEYSLFIPGSYQDVQSLDAEDGASNWQIMGQWHDQPDECLGQTWDDIGSNPPPIALYYNYLRIADAAYQEILNDPNVGDMYGFDPSWDEVSIFALVYGGETIALTAVQKDEWIRLKYHIKWSLEGDGFMQAWINEEPFTDGRVLGSNMLNKASHYFKFGLYRNPTIPFTNSIYYDSVEIY